MSITAAISAPPLERVARVMNAKGIADFLARNAAAEPRARRAAEWLAKEHPDQSDEVLVAALSRVLPAIVSGTLNVFFSYKAKDEAIAGKIAEKLQAWSAGKLKIQDMGDLGVKEVGHEWREKIQKAIQQSDWFLLLLPTPGDDRDWVLFEAGYFFRGQGLAGRLVCLHHPENAVADALDALESVPAEPRKVQAFLKGLFHEPDWIPGMPPLNQYLDELDLKAGEIVGLIERPVMGLKRCCGPHIEVAFEDASAVTGWEQLALGRVLESNDDSRRLFGLDLRPPLFGDWMRMVEGAGRNDGWVVDLARAVQAAGKGLQVPVVRATFGVADGRRVRPSICAVRRRKSDGKLEAVDILFNETDLPAETAHMKPELAALAITLQYAVRLRYQILERFAGRQLERKDVQAFNRAFNELAKQAIRDSRFADPDSLRKLTLASFTGDDWSVVEKMYERADQLWRRDCEGEVDRAIANLDGEALATLVAELIDMNQRFLEVTSKRFAELIASP